MLILSGVRGDTRRYRTFHLYQQLRLAGISAELSHTTDPALGQKLQRAGIVVLHRAAYDSLVGRIFEKVQQRGGLAIQDVDDLVFDPAVFRWINSPDFQDPVRATLYQNDMKRYRRTLESSQAVLASTNFLASHARQYHPHVWIHRNAFSFEMLAASEAALTLKPPSSDRLVIGYASGTPTHNRDFSLVAPALQTFLSRHAQAELWLVGPLQLGSDWQPFENRIRRYSLVPWRELPALLGQFDINLAPLANDNPFNRSKSEIKYMEAAMVKVPTVASGTDAFQYAIQSGENGLLAENEDQWLSSLERLLDPAERQRIGEQAYAAVMEQYHPAARAIQAVRTFAEICQVAGKPELFERVFGCAELEGDHLRQSPSSAVLLPQNIEQHPNRIDQGIYILQNQSLKILLGQIWVFFRRLFVRWIPYHQLRTVSEKLANFLQEEYP